MGTIVKSIKILIWVALVSLLLTYLISLNIEICFISIGCNVVSNNFLFAVFSGIFTSTLVVLICEIYKYYDTKKRVESVLFTQLASLYGQLLIIRNNVGRYLHNLKDPLPMELLQMPTSNSLTILNNIRIIEYCSFKGKSEIEDGLQSFNNDIAARLDNFLIDCRVLDIAIYEDRISFMQNGISNPVITSICDKSHKVLVIINKQIEGYINEVDSFIIKIDQKCNERYDWVKRRNSMSQNILYSKFSGLEDFISKNN